ncbi:MAG: helix-turn-helix domain-containing protein [Thermodesulfobacteriota bacterium]
MDGNGRGRNPNLVAEREAASQLGMTVRALQNWRSRGEGPPYIKLGRSVRYSPEALERYVAERTCDPRSADGAA